MRRKVWQFKLVNEHFIKFKGDTEEERLKALRNIIEYNLKGKAMIFVRNKLEVGDLQGN